MGESTAAAHDLLDLLMAPFRAHCVYAAAALRIPDRLSAGVGTAEQLAEQTGADIDALRRLLRMLAALDVVAGDDRAGYRLGALGELLRSDHPQSMRDLPLCYAEQFYPPFRHVLNSLDTGGQSFARVFDEPLFEYFAHHPEAGRLFDGAMAASAVVFQAVPTAVDFSHARHVVDVAGGDGTLLASILAAHPHLRGTLAEVPRLAGSALDRLSARGVADRCEVVGCDFFAAVPPGGDTYVLSRVLHDWDDQRCGDLLRRVRAAMAPLTTLLVVERVVPKEGEASLAVDFDLHMLVNTGGRERTLAEYDALLVRAGFSRRATVDLPLDVHVLVAVAVADRAPSEQRAASA